MFSYFRGVALETKVCAKTLAGDGDCEPAYIKMHTNPSGAAINIVPFPKR